MPEDRAVTAVSLAQCVLSSWQALMPHSVEGSSGWQPAQTSITLEFEVSAFLFLLLTALFSHTRMRFLGALGRKVAMFTCFEIIGLFLAWIKYALPAIQPRSLIHNVVLGPKPQLITWYSLPWPCHLYTFSFFHKLHRSSDHYIIRLHTPLEFCHLSHYTEKSISSSPPFT